MKAMANWRIRSRLLLAFLAVLIPYLLSAGVGAAALWIIWQNVSGMYQEAAVEHERLSDVESAVASLEDSARQYLTVRTPESRRQLDQARKQLQERLALLQPGSSDDVEERDLVGALKNLGIQIESSSQAILWASTSSTETRALTMLETLRQRIDEAFRFLNRAQALGFREMKEERRRVSGTIRWYAAVGLSTLSLSLAGGAALALILSRWLSRPVLAIAQTSRRMAAGDLSQRVAIQAGGELGEAARAFNEMAERLEASIRENVRLFEEVQGRAVELESRVKERTAELEKALQVKVEFLGNMSHELRTPLNFVLGFADLLKSGAAGPLTAKQEHYLERVQTGATRLLELVTDLLDISQLEAGKTGLRLESVSLGPLVHGILEALRVQVTQKRLSVSKELPPEASRMVADRDKLSSILSHLLGNAVKFTPEGGTVRVTARRAAQIADCKLQIADLKDAQPISQSEILNLQSEMVEIAVTDTGIGISPDDLERVFVPFHQVDGSDKRAYGGAGLGLALVRKLVTLHGGTVWAESEGPGQGARFVVRLPQLESPPPKRILVVEGDPAFQDLLQAALKEAAYVVERAESGAWALAVLEATPPDLLVVDIRLPDMDGWAILEQVRTRESTRDLPVLILTGLTDISLDQARARGADEFLTKPVSPQVLLETVARLVEGRMQETEKT